MTLGVTGFLVMLPAVSDACQPVPDSTHVSAAQVADAIGRGSDVLIVGDSYTTGRGSYDGTHGWAQDLVTARGWNGDIDGLPGTGYVAEGRWATSRTTYESRIRAHADLHPALVIVQGSQNDWSTDAATLTTAVERTLRTARDQWPEAVVVAVGPSAPEPRADSTAGISAAVAAGAGAAGVPYVDPLAGQWFTRMNSASYAAGDGEHLNDDGYLYLAGRIEDALQELATPATGQQCV